MLEGRGAIDGHTYHFVYIVIYSEPFQIFNGGMAYEKGVNTPSLTVIHGKSTTVLEMEHKVIDFITLCPTPWTTGLIHNIDM